jgi:hypothetical protein
VNESAPSHTNMTGEVSAPGAATALGADRPLDTATTRCSMLGNNRSSSGLDQDIYTFRGKAQEQVTVTVQADPDGAHIGITSPCSLPGERQRICGSPALYAMAIRVPKRTFLTLKPEKKYPYSIYTDTSGANTFSGAITVWKSLGLQPVVAQQLLPSNSTMRV